MNDLVVREVNFHGDSLLAVKQEDKVYVGVSYICNGIGLPKKKADYEIERIQNDIVLNKGTRKIGVPSNGGIQESVCIELDYLPLWLAKINANIIKDKEAQQKLIEYQLKVKDVLANAFIDKANFIIPQTYSEALKLAANFAEEAEQFRQFMKSNEGIDMDEVANVLKIPKLGRNKLYEWLRKQKILMSGVRHNIPYSTYSHYFEVIEVVNNGKPFSKCLVKPSGVSFILKKIKKEIDLLKQA